MTKYSDKISDILANIDDNKAFHEDTITRLFVLLRQHLEANSLKSKYNLLNLYCNWLVHVSLDRGSLIQNFLDEISKIWQSDPVDYNDKVNLALSIKELRAELLDLLNSLDTNTYTINSYNGWKTIVGVLLDSLIDKPLTRNRKYTGSGCYVQSIELIKPDISELDEEYVREFNLRDGTIFWKVFVMPANYYLSGPLVITERSNDFLNP